MATSNELSRFLHDSDAGEVWEAPTAEMLWWTRRLGWLIAPAPGRETWASRLVGLVAVTPSAHVANLSLHFQSFLFDVFHQTRTARVGHVVCMPIINMMVLVFAAGVSSALGAGPSGADAIALLLGIWYLVQAAHNRVVLLGVAMLPVTAVTWIAARAWWHAFALPPTEATWWAPTPWLENPILWMAIGSLAQAATHGPEPKLPPRVSGTAHWMSLRRFLLGPPGSPHAPSTVVVRLVRAALQILFGALDEFWASWRLIPLNVLEVMWRLGYRPGMYAEYKDLSRRAIAHGDPAIDFIGVGGGAVIRDPSGV